MRHTTIHHITYFLMRHTTMHYITSFLVRHTTIHYITYFLMHQTILCSLYHILSDTALGRTMPDAVYILIFTQRTTPHHTKIVWHELLPADTFSKNLCLTNSILNNLNLLHFILSDNSIDDLFIACVIWKYYCLVNFATVANASRKIIHSKLLSILAHFHDTEGKIGFICFNHCISLLSTSEDSY
jgi:hypothetical protein